MKQIFYLYEPGILQQKDGSLALETSKETYYLPIEQIYVIMCFADVTLNKRVISLLNKHHISIIFFSYYGGYIGRYMPKKYEHGKYLIEQVSCFTDMNKRLYVSKAFTRGYIKSMLSVAHYYCKKNKLESDKVECIQHFLVKVDQASTIEDLLIVEANCKQVYYSIFDDILINDSFKFELRTKKPPKNEMNAMLSYGYSLLYAVVLTELEKSNLVPQISFIHSVSKSFDSLQYDIADIFKPIIIDRMILRMIRKRQISLDHFKYHDDGSCFMNKEGLKIFSVEFDEQLKSVITFNNRRLSYRSLIKTEIYNLQKYIFGQEAIYKTIVFKW